MPTEIHGDINSITPEDIIRSGKLTTIRTFDEARRFLVPVPKMDNDAPGVEYIGDKEASDWIQDPESGEYVETKLRLASKGKNHGFTFLNPKDNSEQIVATDGNTFLIIPNLRDEKVPELESFILERVNGSFSNLNQLTVDDLKAIISKAAELQVFYQENSGMDIYDTDRDWVGTEENPGNVLPVSAFGIHGFGQHHKKGKELEAVLLEGTVFKGTSTNHSLRFVVIHEDDKWRASQIDVFVTSYTQRDGSSFDIDSIDSQLPKVTVGDLLTTRIPPGHQASGDLTADGGLDKTKERGS